MQKHLVYISLGSNMGDRQKWLEKGLLDLEREAGAVLNIAPIYETPAVGFDGPPFYNSCVLLETTLLPLELMQTCLAIEKKHGRVRTAQSSSRTLDLDLLFYDDLTLEHDELILPHPRLHQRAFVLHPLASIAPSKVHPKLKLAVSDLLHNCLDKQEITDPNVNLLLPTLAILKNIPTIVIEGNIGSGKTSLVEKISDKINAKTMFERFADNPFLPKFYADPDRYSFPLELSFLADRFRQASAELAQFDLFQQNLIADYSIHKSLIFAQTTLEEDEYKLYRTFFELVTRDIPTPDAYFFLMQTPERLLENIQKRGRSYEQKIEKSYLEKVQENYMTFIKSRPEWPIVVVDCTDLDFIENQRDFSRLLRRMAMGFEAL